MTKKKKTQKKEKITFYADKETKDNIMNGIDVEFVKETKQFYKYDKKGVRL